ncbi:hypothetical protein AAFF_G00313010, partial [Aldrovandia affinis]
VRSRQGRRSFSRYGERIARKSSTGLPSSDSRWNCRTGCFSKDCGLYQSVDIRSQRMSRWTDPRRRRAVTTTRQCRPRPQRCAWEGPTAAVCVQAPPLSRPWPHPLAPDA